MSLDPGVYRVKVGGSDTLMLVSAGGGYFCQDDSEDVADLSTARPLTLLNLDALNVGNLIRTLGMAGFHGLATQVREQIKPARMEEPGLWGVVEARAEGYDVRFKWVRSQGGLWCTFGTSAPDPVFRKWEFLIGPTMIRQGI